MPKDFNLLHYNPKTGKSGRCRAEKGNCPFIDTSDPHGGHYETQEEIDAYIERKSQEAEKPSNTLQSKEKELEYLYGKDSASFLRPYSIEIPEKVSKVIDELSEIGNPLIVGGAVRDSFEGFDNKDIDIEVHKTDIDTMVKFLKRKGYKVDEVGKQFGVLKVSGKGVTDLDLSVPRRENRTGAGHRSFSVDLDNNLSPLEAAERRDFTFNAVMYDHRRKLLVDPAKGAQDYQDKVMRHVSEKFSEDPLRVLRGFQFAGRFSMTYAPETAELCRSIRGEYSDLSVERVREEFTKFYTKGKDPQRAIEALQDSGWDNIEPGLDKALRREGLASELNSLEGLQGDSKNLRDTIGAALLAKGMTDKSHRSNIFNKTLLDKDRARKAEAFLDLEESLSKESSDSPSYRAHRAAKELQSAKSSWSEFKHYLDARKNRDLLSNFYRASLELGIDKAPERPLIGGKFFIDKGVKPGPALGEFFRRLEEKQFRGEVKTVPEAENEALSYMKEKGLIK